MERNVVPAIKNELDRAKQDNAGLKSSMDRMKTDLDKLQRDNGDLKLALDKTARDLDARNMDNSKLNLALEDLGRKLRDCENNLQEARKWEPKYNSLKSDFDRYRRLTQTGEPALRPRKETRRQREGR